MRQSGVTHDSGDGRTRQTFLARSRGSGIEDALQRFFLAFASGWP